MPDKFLDPFPLKTKLQCHLMMISAFPDADPKETWPRSFVHIFKSPDFEPVSFPVHKVGAIGCGTAIGSCQRVVDELSNNHEAMFSVMQGEQGCPGGMANLLGFNLTRVLKDTQPRGISAHLHYCWVYCKKVIIKTNDHSVAGAWTTFGTGSGINEPEQGPVNAKKATEEKASFAMPTLATSWNELERLLDATGAKAKGCVA